MFFTGGSAAQVISFVTKEFHIKNFPILHIYTIIEFSWITWFYHVAMPDYLPRKKTITTLILFAAGSALCSIFLQPPLTQFNTYARTAESIIIIVFALTYFYKTMNEMQILNLEKEPLFWVNVGFLIYFSGGTLLFVFSNFILPFRRDLNIYVWSLHAIFNILLCLIQSIGVWMAAHKQT